MAPASRIMQSEPYRHRYLQLALLLSLSAHMLLLMPWQFGKLFAPDTFYSGEKSMQPRLNVTLKKTADSALKETITAQLPQPGGKAHDEPKASPPAPPPQQLDTPVPASGLPLDALYYYAITELDQRPLMRHPPRLESAPLGMNIMAKGSATLELLIERTGRVNAVNLLRTDLPESYIRSLEAAFIALRYIPGIRHQQNVRSRLYIEVEYQDGVLSNMSSIQYTAVPAAPMVDTKQVSQERKVRRLKDH